MATKCKIKKRFKIARTLKKYGSGSTGHIHVYACDEKSAIQEAKKQDKKVLLSALGINVSTKLMNDTIYKIV